MRFGLVIGFSEHLQLVTTTNNKSLQIYIAYNSLWYTLSLLSPLCLHQCPLVLASNIDVSLPLGSQNVPTAQPQHLSTESLTNSQQLLLSTDRLLLIITAPSYRPLVWIKLRIPPPTAPLLLCQVAITENTASNRSSIVVCMTVVAVT
jgi:hypothetical protein